MAGEARFADHIIDVVASLPYVGSHAANGCPTPCRDCVSPSRADGVKEGHCPPLAAQASYTAGSLKERIVQQVVGGRCCTTIASLIVIVYHRYPHN